MAERQLNVLYETGQVSSRPQASSSVLSVDSRGLWIVLEQKNSVARAWRIPVAAAGGGERGLFPLHCFSMAIAR